jgi:MoaA/NifB/PqqE/SkfB family radical SAM enzyme
MNLDDFEWALKFIKSFQEKHLDSFKGKIILWFYQELLLHPQWTRIVNLAEKHGFSNMVKDPLPTNGSFIACHMDNPGFIRQFEEFKPSSVQLVFHGKKERHDRYAGRQGAFDDICSTARFLKNRKIPVQWQYFFSNENIADFPLVYDLIKELDMKDTPGLRAVIGSYFGRMRINDALRPTREDFQILPDRYWEVLSSDSTEKNADFFSQFITENEIYDGQKSLKVISYNLFELLYPVIFSHLELYGANWKSGYLGNLRDTDADKKMFWIYNIAERFENILNEHDMGKLIHAHLDENNKQLYWNMSLVHKLMLRIIKKEGWLEKYGLGTIATDVL